MREAVRERRESPAAGGGKPLFPPPLLPYFSRSAPLFALHGVRVSVRGQTRGCPWRPRAPRRECFWRAWRCYGEGRGGGGFVLGVGGIESL